MYYILSRHSSCALIKYNCIDCCRCGSFYTIQLIICRIICRELLIYKDRGRYIEGYPRAGQLKHNIFIVMCAVLSYIGLRSLEHIDGFEQDRCNFSANTLGLCLSSIKSSICASPGQKLNVCLIHLYLISFPFILMTFHLYGWCCHCSHWVLDPFRIIRSWSLLYHYLGIIKVNIISLLRPSFDIYCQAYCTFFTLSDKGGIQLESWGTPKGKFDYNRLNI